MLIKRKACIIVTGFGSRLSDCSVLYWTYIHSERFFVDRFILLGVRSLSLARVLSLFNFLPLKDCFVLFFVEEYGYCKESKSPQVYADSL